MRIALLIEYDGTNYCGWQIQPNGITVQQIIEEGLHECLGEKVDVIASGRTDSGVHAIGQAAHFDSPKNIPAESYAHILNAVLPSDICIIKSISVTDSFHARYSAKSKTYAYSAYISSFERPLSNRFAVRISKVDIQKMRDAANMLVGKHDFRAFCSSGSEVKNFTREIFAVHVGLEREMLTITIKGSGFLYNMVRIIAGTLIEIGYDRLSSDCITKAFMCGERELLGRTMPPRGLTLTGVEYDEISFFEK